MLGLACQGAVMLYLAAVLPEEAFGRYSFFVGFVAVTQLLFEGGFFAAVARASAFREGATFRSLLGFTMIASGAIYLVYFLAILAVAFGANQLDKVYIEYSLIPAIIFAPAILIHYGLTQVCVGANRVRLLGVLQAAPLVLNLLATVAVRFFDRLTYTSAAVCYTAPFLATAILVFALLRPRFDTLRPAFNDVWQYARFALDMYIARIVATGVYKLDGPLVAFFLDFDTLGHYSLARALVMPFILVTQSFCSTRFKRYARATRIPSKDLWTVYAVSLAAGAAPVFLGAVALQFFYPDKPAVFFVAVQILGIRVFFQSAYGLYNMYLYASGRSAALRWASLICATLNLALYLALIPAFGLLGAVWADTLLCGGYFGCMLWSYSRRTSLEQRGDSDESGRFVSFLTTSQDSDEPTLSISMKKRAVAA